MKHIATIENMKGGYLAAFRYSASNLFTAVGVSMTRPPFDGFKRLRDAELPCDTFRFLVPKMLQYKGQDAINDAPETVSKRYNYLLTKSVARYIFLGVSLFTESRVHKRIWAVILTIYATGCV